MENFVNRVKEIYLPKRYQKHNANKILHHSNLPTKKYYTERNPVYKITKPYSKVKRVKPRKPIMGKHKKTKNYKTNPVGEYFLQNEQQPTSKPPDLFSNISNVMTNMQRDLRNIWDSKNHSPSKPIDYVQDVEVTESPKKLEYIPDQLDVLRKFGVFEDSKSIIEDNFERFKYISEPLHDSGRSHHYSPPSYHPPPPSYHPPAPAPYHPPPYKAVYEVDFTPLFLSLLPVFLVLGTLLGLALSGLTSTASTVSLVGTNSTGSTVTVNVNSTSSSTSTGGSGTGNTTSILPIYIFTNGTYTVPIIGTGLLGLGGLTGLTGLTNFGLGGLFGLGNLGGFFFGRSFSEPYFYILQYFLDILQEIIEYFQEAEEEGDYVYFEPA